MSELKKSSRLEQIRKSTPKDIEIYVDKSYAIIDRIYEILDRKGLEQKDLANSLDKYESEISKWLKGSHNFTIQTISKIEAILGEDIICIPPIRKERIPIEYSQKFFTNVFFQLPSRPVTIPFSEPKVKKPCGNIAYTDLIYYNPSLAYASSGKNKKAYEEIWAD